LGYVRNKISLVWYQTFVEKNYNPGVGFLARGSFINTRPEMTLFLRSPWLKNHLRFFLPTFKADVYHEAVTKTFQEANLTIAPLRVETQTGTEIAVSFLPSWQDLPSEFALLPGLLIPKGKYKYFRTSFLLNTNQSAPYSLMANATFGNFYDGKLDSYTLSARIVPIVNISGALNYTYNHFHGFAGNGNLVTHLLAPELRVSWNAKIQLSGIYQYNTSTNLAGLNLRFSWEYQPLSFIYLVFNDLRTIEQPDTGKIKDTAAIFKISYIRQL
jgi:hypothetical protein